MSALLCDECFRLPDPRAAELAALRERVATLEKENGELRALAENGLQATNMANDATAKWLAEKGRVEALVSALDKCAAETVEDIAAWVDASLVDTTAAALIRLGVWKKQ